MTLSERDRQFVWHPYTQMFTAPDAAPIVKGRGAMLYREDGRPLLDAISSWWVTVHGHAHPYIAEAIGKQAAELEQVIFAGFTHPQAVELAERLIGMLPDVMSKVFYSDNGSTAVEVALKMAWQYWQNNGEARTGILALENAYHGDTFGAMSVSGRSIFTKAFDELLFNVNFLPSPGEVDEEVLMESLEKLTTEQDYAALVLEPLVQGAGGMAMYSPKTLDAIVAFCRSKGILIIFDEVMTGFYRTGSLFASSQCEHAPDIICLSKGLTAGFLPLSVTACTEEIYQAFLDEDQGKMLFHGHSFTANPLGCAAANASLDLFAKPETQAMVAGLCEVQEEGRKALLNHPGLKNVRRTGTILAMDMVSQEETCYLNELGHPVAEWFYERDILIRPLGNVLYLMPPYNIDLEQLREVQNMIPEVLEAVRG